MSLPCCTPCSACSKPRSVAHTTASSQQYSFPSWMCFPRSEGRWRWKQPKEQLRSCAGGPRWEGWANSGPGLEFRLGSAKWDALEQGFSSPGDTVPLAKSDTGGGTREQPSKATGRELETRNGWKESGWEQAGFL